MIDKIYQWLLWVAGEPITDEELDELKGGGDKWTYHMRRSKKRLGNWWWVMVFATIILVEIRLFVNIRDKKWVRVSLLILTNILIIWLLPHVVWGCW